MTTAQQCHALTTFFLQEVQRVHGTKPSVNRNKARWGFEAMLMDYSPSQARELIEFYVKYMSNPTIEWFLFNYEKVDSQKQEHEQNKVRAVKIMTDTQARVEQWRARWQQPKPE